MPHPKEPTCDENTANQTTGAHTRVLIRLRPIMKGNKIPTIDRLDEVAGQENLPVRGIFSI